MNPDAEILQASAVRFLIDGNENDAASTLLSCNLSVDESGDTWHNGDETIYALHIELEGPRAVYETLRDGSHNITKAIKDAIQAVLPRDSYLKHFSARAQLIEIDPDWRNELLQIARGKIVHNQAVEAERVLTWNNHRFRSQAEIRLAGALEKSKVLFLPNCKARLGISKRENREPDFLVCHHGKWGILEVDGEPYHPPSRAVEDHERDRLFLAHGVKLVQHFDAGECFENAEGVVKKFLYLLERA
jgi:hypothetical protein